MARLPAKEQCSVFALDIVVMPLVGALHDNNDRDAQLVLPSVEATAAAMKGAMSITCSA